MLERLFVPLVFVFLLLNEIGQANGQDPVLYRSQSLDPRVRRVPAEIQQGVFNDPAKHLEPLVRFLVAGGRDGFHKVKILHDWIADNIAYDVEAYFSDAGTDATGQGTLKRRRGVCQGYAKLMEEMCELADIPCRTISGYGRGYGFSSGRETDASESNHAWNAIHVDGRWHLVDVTWDAGNVDGRAYEKEYCTAYLFMEPKNFVYTHLPKESRWQLLAEPLTVEQFERLPYLRGRFFDHGLRLGTKLSRVTRVDESVQFRIRFSQEVKIMAELLTADDEELPRRTLVQREERSCRVFVTFPTAGRYRVRLYCQKLGSAGALKWAADFDFQTASGTARTFPTTYGRFRGMRGYLFSPLYMPLATDKPLLFKVRLHDAHDVSLAIGDEPWLELKPSPDEKSVYQLETSVPDGVRVRLNAKTSPDNESYATLIEFTKGG